MPLNVLVLVVLVLVETLVEVVLTVEVVARRDKCALVT